MQITIEWSVTAGFEMVWVVWKNLCEKELEESSTQLEKILGKFKFQEESSLECFPDVAYMKNQPMLLSLPLLLIEASCLVQEVTVIFVIYIH